MAPVSRQPGKAGAKRGSRKEAIVESAAQLFSQRGYPATGIDEIGEGAGITGPGVYRHFESKQHLLAAILDRNLQQHQDIVAEVEVMGLPPRDALEKLVELSASALAANRDAAALYFQEARNLPPDELTRYTRIQRNLITEWVKLLRQVRPGVSDEDARVAVRAVAGMLNSVGYFTTTMPSERLATLLSRMAIAALLDADGG